MSTNSERTGVRLMKRSNACISVKSFRSCFEVVQGPRTVGRRAHPLATILFLVVTAVISEADGPADIEDFGKEKQGWLEQFVAFPAGMSSCDTIGRLLALIDPKPLQNADALTIV